MSLSSLSTELVEQILYFLADDVKSLFTLSLVSKAFDDLSTPRLYHTFFGPQNYGTERGLATITFLKTVLERPDVARHVKRVLLLGFGETLHETTSEERMRLYKPAVHYFCESRSPDPVEEVDSATLKFEAQWLDYRGKGSEDATVALLLCLLPEPGAVVLWRTVSPHLYYANHESDREGTCRRRHHFGFGVQRYDRKQKSCITVSSFDSYHIRRW